ncbi:hypothetical protein IG631_17518 [Alternaria alternata]|nr:hypothetical protein IG631_17518 [Alternaria alternata]
MTDILYDITVIFPVTSSTAWRKAATDTSLVCSWAFGTEWVKKVKPPICTYYWGLTRRRDSSTTDYITKDAISERLDQSFPTCISSSTLFTYRLPLC